jgi:acyl-coenzyme A synthetase/AMP-(fatty) acid ligase
LNVAYNCVDRHVEAGLGERVAVHFEGEPGDTQLITYAELKDEVSRAANALTELGVGKGDRVAIYLPMIPEAIVAMLASHPRVAESAVGGAADATTGQAIVAFVILRDSAQNGAQDATEGGADLAAALRDHVGKALGAIAKPKRVLIVGELPKTRSGKMMRRQLRDVAENRELGDVTTLTDASVMGLIQAAVPTAASED